VPGKDRSHRPYQNTRRDPLKENPSTLITIPIERTMAGGRWTFES
jgi:hypothetical protein